jgi:imidazolonepropionase
VFCETGYFSLNKPTKSSKPVAHGLVPKIHVNQFNAIGGVGVGVKNKRLSVDHLE